MYHFSPKSDSDALNYCRISVYQATGVDICLAVTRVQVY